MKLRSRTSKDKNVKKELKNKTQMIEQLRRETLNIFSFKLKDVNFENSFQVFIWCFSGPKGSILIDKRNR